MDLFNLKGKTALITGSNGGIGFTLAKGLGEAGANIILNGRNIDKLNKAKEELLKVGLNVDAYAFDVSKPDEIDSASSEILKKHNIDILVNNAGIHKRMSLTEMTDEAWDDVIKTNLNSAFYVTRRFITNMKNNVQGKIINICSLMSEVHRPSIANYSASKGGLKMLTRAMAVEFGPFNIQTNAIGPGYFKTELTEKLVKDQKFNEWICGRTPMNRWGNIEELVGTAIYLASDASSYVNGQLIFVDGGMLSAL